MDSTIVAVIIAATVSVAIVLTTNFVFQPWRWKQSLKVRNFEKRLEIHDALNVYKSLAEKSKRRMVEGKKAEPRTMENPYDNNRIQRIQFDVIIPAVIKKLEEITGIKISEEELNIAIKHAMHVVIHELAHEYLEKAVPWLKITDDVHILIDEVLTRFLERKISTEFGLFVESFEEQLEELRMYSSLKHLAWDANFYSMLYDKFDKCLSQGESIERFAKNLLKEAPRILKGEI